MERELLFREHHSVLAVWLPESSVNLLKKFALDFWDWVTYDFYFPLSKAAKIQENLAGDNYLSESFDKEFLKQLLEQLGQKTNSSNKETLAYNSMLQKASGYSLAARLFESMQQLNIPADANTFSALLIKSPDYQTAKTHFEQMKTAGLEPNEISYNTLVNKSRGLRNGEKAF